MSQNGTLCLVDSWKLTLHNSKSLFLTRRFVFFFAVKPSPLCPKFRPAPGGCADVTVNFCSGKCKVGEQCCRDFCGGSSCISKFLRALFQLFADFVCHILKITFCIVVL